MDRKTEPNQSGSLGAEVENACGTCFAWERIEQAWGLCAVDDVETRVDDLCECFVFSLPTPPEAV